MGVHVGLHKKRPCKSTCASLLNRVAVVVGSALDKNPFENAIDLTRIARDSLGVAVSSSTVARARRLLGFRFKLASRSSRHQRPPPSHPFMSNISVYDDAISLDEASFLSCDRPRRGWARGSAPVPKPPPKQRPRTSLLLAIDGNGVVGYQMKTGSFNSASYASFLETLPQSRRIIADNVSFHKGKHVRETAARRDQHLVFTPPYCPWFNPTEFAFSSTKHAYRKARLQGDVDFRNHVQGAVEQLTPEKCNAFFRHARHEFARETDRNCA